MYNKIIGVVETYLISITRPGNKIILQEHNKKCFQILSITSFFIFAISILKLLCSLQRFHSPPPAYENEFIF